MMPAGAADHAPPGQRIFLCGEHRIDTSCAYDSALSPAAAGDFGDLVLSVVWIGAVWQMTAGSNEPGHILERAGEVASRGLLSTDSDPAL